MAEDISRVLYPNDSTDEGKKLRLRQQYFFVSASLQDIIKNFKKVHGREFIKIPEFIAIQLNDTHPVIAIPELMRILVDIEGVLWEDAWEIVKKTFSYTNHTILAEALEKWWVGLYQEVVPRIFQITEGIHNQFKNELAQLYPNDQDKQNRMQIIQGNMIHMAWLAIYGSHKVNGVAELHTEILKERELRDWYELYPEKFLNKTNGITQRRWLLKANPELSSLITELIGDGWTTDLYKLKELEKYLDDENVLNRVAEIKLHNKERLANYIKETTGIEVNPHSIFDVQVKRLHEYKRQLLNALHIVYLYHEIKYNGLRPTPRTFIFAAKASSGYQMAKNIIKFIHSISQMIESDELVREYIKVVFIPDYKVTLAEIILPAADVSEQISQAGKEASGTGNMKLMLNGAVTLGTMDGANVEIYEAVGEDNIVIFGLETEEVEALYAKGYKPWEYYNNSPKIKTVLDFIRTMTVGGMNFNFIVDYLLTQDHYMCLADFDSYVEAQERIEKDFNDSSKWMKMSLANIANAGIFSADRSVKEYAKDIWHIKPVQG